MSDLQFAKGDRVRYVSGALMQMYEYGFHGPAPMECEGIVTDSWTVSSTLEKFTAYEIDGGPLGMINAAPNQLTLLEKASERGSEAPAIDDTAEITERSDPKAAAA